MDSIVSIKQTDAEEKKKKAEESLEEILAHAPFALAKFRHTTPPYTAAKLYRRDIDALVTRYFLGMPPKWAKKFKHATQLIAAFEKLMVEKPNVLAAVQLPAEIDQAPARKSKKRARSTTMQENKEVEEGDSDGDDDDEEDMEVEEDEDESEDRRASSSRRRGRETSDEEEEEDTIARHPVTKRQRQASMLQNGTEVWVVWSARHGDGEEEYKAIITKVHNGHQGLRYDLYYPEDEDEERGVFSRFVRPVVDGGDA